MNYLSLYRKYRPRSFKDVVGQEYIVQILKNSIKNNKIANAYVFAGTKGTGKTSIAKIYANAMNCLQSQDGDICCQCDVCKDFANQQVVDVVELDAASNNGVDEVRKISEDVYTLPAFLKKKVYIIDEAHMLTTAAWNALLKVVEEPPQHVVFIFATTEMHMIPATILSRCQCFRFNKILTSDIIKLLVRVCKAENFEYEDEAIKAIAELTDGSARDALSVLDEVATFSDNKIKVSDIYRIYGLLSPIEIVDLLNLIKANKNDQVFALANKYFQSGINFSNFANLIVSIITDKLIYAKTKNPDLLHKTNYQLISNLAIDDVNLLIQLLDIWQEVYFKISVPTDVRVIIDHAILKSMTLFNNQVTETKSVVETKKEIKCEEVVIKPQHFEKVETVSNVQDKKPIEVNKQLPPLVAEEIFFDKPKTVEAVKQATPVTETLDEKVQEVNEEIIPEPKTSAVMPSNEEILTAAFVHKTSDNTNAATTFFNDVKSGKIEDPIFASLKSASKVLCASKNAMVVICADDIDAKRINKDAKGERFILECCKRFDDPKFLVAFTPSQVNALKDKLMSAKKQGVPMLNIDALRQVLDASGSIEQIAYNTVYKFIVEEKKKEENK